MKNLFQCLKNFKITPDKIILLINKINSEQIHNKQSFKNFLQECIECNFILKFISAITSSTFFIKIIYIWLYTSAWPS